MKTKLISALCIMAVILSLLTACQKPEEPSDTEHGTGHTHSYLEKEGTYKCECGADYFADTLDFTVNEDGSTCTVAGIGSCTKRDIVIPTEYNGMRVTKIGVEAFFCCETIDTVVIPEGITEIGDSAFCEATVRTISLPQTLSRIGEYAFADTLLETVTVPHADIICNGAFDGSLNLREIILCEGVKKVESAFDGLRNLEKIIFPNSIEISEDCFALFSSPTLYDLLNDPEQFESRKREFTIYNDVIYIGNETNPYLVAHTVAKYTSDIVLHPDTEIILPEICYGLDYGKKTSISSVVIPKNVRTVCHKYSLLFKCAENVYYEGTADEWEKLVGDAKTYDAKIYFYSEAEPTEAGYYWHYTDSGEVAVWGNETEG